MATNTTSNGDKKFTIPVIRLQDDDKQKTVGKLRDACTNVGFFYLENHGVDSTLMESVLRESKRLFDLPLNSKKNLFDPIINRGYTGMEKERLDPALQTERGDTKEGFYIGRELSSTDPRYNPAKLSGPNQWPSPEKTPEMENPEIFRSVMMEYMGQLRQAGLKLVQLLALAIGLEDEHFFDQAFVDEPMALLRLLHYDPVQSRPEKGIFACGAHSDYGMVTLLLTDGSPGLQILTKSNEWEYVPHREGAFVVNLGDMLERWTNGLFRSTKHRVIINDSNQLKDRYSVPFFFEPAFDTVVECLPACVSEDRPAQYKPTTSGQHLLDMYAVTYF